MCTPVNVVVVGTGSWSIHAHLPAIVSDQRARLSGIVDPDPEARGQAQRLFGPTAEFASVEELLEAARPDAAVVAVPHSLHARVARPLLQAGVHVLLEKPMVLDPADGRELLAIARDVGVELLVDYPYHYNRQVADLRERICAGHIGQLEFSFCLFASSVRGYYQGHTNRPDLGYAREPRPTTYSDPALAGGGQGQTQVTHSAALLLHLIGARPVTVSATEARFGLRVDLADAMIVRFDDGSIAAIGSTGGMVPGHEDLLELRIFGSNGHIAFDVTRGYAATFGPDGEVDELPPLDPAERYPEAAAVRNLVGVVADGSGNQSPGELGQTVVELLAAMYRSAAEGARPVQVGAGMRG